MDPSCGFFARGYDQNCPKNATTASTPKPADLIVERPIPIRRALLHPSTEFLLQQPAIRAVSPAAADRQLAGCYINEPAGRLTNPVPSGLCFSRELSAVRETAVRENCVPGKALLSVHLCNERDSVVRFFPSNEQTSSFDLLVSRSKSYSGCIYVTASTTVELSANQKMETHHHAHLSHLKLQPLLETSRPEDVWNCEARLVRRRSGRRVSDLPSCVRGKYAAGEPWREQGCTQGERRC
ncbi:hypothetical protein C8R43DRAFT_180550 [Mycena crocata]|nr:hypothetical protein C8R43DRAFT_180550 [Mycena crocata]